MRTMKTSTENKLFKMETLFHAEIAVSLATLGIFGGMYLKRATENVNLTWSFRFARSYAAYAIALVLGMVR